MSEELATPVEAESTPEIETTENLEGSVEAGSEESTAEAVSNLSSQEQGELQTDIQDAIEDGATQEEVQDLIEQFVLKVNGKEIVKEINLNDKDALQRELQMAAAGRQSMQRSAELEKAYADALSELKGDTARALADAGIDVDSFVKQYVENQIEELKKSPQELAQEKYEKELQQAREAEKKAQEELKKMQYEQVMAEENAKLESEISEALDAYESLPDNPMVRQKIAETMVWAMENGFNDVTAKDIMPTVEKEFIKQQQDLFNSMPVKYIENFIGKANMEKMRENRIAKAKAIPQKPDITEVAKKEVENSKNERKKVKARDFFKNLGKN